MKSHSRAKDQMVAKAGYNRMPDSKAKVWGHGEYVLAGPDGKIKQRGTFENLITQVGDQVYAERGANVGGPPSAPTGMRLGTGGATAAAKTGAGAAIVAYVAGSSKAFDGAAASSLQGTARRIQYVTTWNPGEATANGINEAVVTNENPLTNVAGAAGNTISRAVLSPVVNKGAGDTLTLTWNHELEGT